MRCAECGRELTTDETGLSRKLINRGTTVFFCLDCLSRRFGISAGQLQELIAAFREAGCTLFPPDAGTDSDRYRASVREKTSKRT